jgi:hypothetical protein
LTVAVPASTAAAVTVLGQLIVGALDVPVKLTVTAKLQVSPLCAVQVTVVLPIGKVEPDGGLQTTAPQLPGGVGTKYVTMALHPAVSTGTTDGHVSVQPEVEPTTVADADAELSAPFNSFVALEMLAVLVIKVPAGVPLFTV